MTNPLIRVLQFINPYRKIALASIGMLTLAVLAELIVPRLLQRIIDEGIVRKDLWIIGTTALAMVVIAIIESAMTIGNTFFSVRVAQGFASDIRSALFRRIQSFSFGNLDKFQTGQLVIRMTSDINITQMMVMMGLRMFIRAPLMIIGSVIMMYAINTELANLMILLMPATLILTGIFVWKAQPMFMLVQGKLDKLNTVLQEHSFVRNTNPKDSTQQAQVSWISQSKLTVFCNSYFLPCF
jgi:ATP-binding cassette subfamily B multidrug efflux pump